MSRITVPSREPGVTVVVGWDNPLDTFFAQVSHNDDPDSDDEPILL